MAKYVDVEQRSRFFNYWSIVKVILHEPYVPFYSLYVSIKVLYRYGDFPWLVAS